MSNYYDTLGQDLAPALGMPPIDQYGQEHPDQIRPPMPPPMPGPAQTASMPGVGRAGPGPGGGSGDGPVPPMPPFGPNLEQPGLPPGTPMPPPMAPEGPGISGDPFNKALTQAGKATQMFSPGAPGIGTPPPAPPMPPPQGGGPPGGPQGPAGPMPPPMRGAGPPTGNSVPFGPSTDYAAAMGIKPTDQNRATSAMAGLGKGLSAAAGNSNKAGAVFSRGAGGAMTGTIQEQQEQQKVAAGLQNQYFNQASKAFTDLQSKRSTDSLQVYRQSMAAWNDAKIAAGGPGAKTFLNSPEGKMHVAWQEAQGKSEADRKLLEVMKNGIDPAEYQKKIEEYQQNREKYLAEAYKKYGVDPKQAENIQTRGFDLPRKFSEIQNGQYYMAPDGTAKRKTANSNDYKPDDDVKWINPFPASKMDLNTFHQTVPNGAYYEKDGKILTRIAPPPAAPGQPAQPDPMADPEAVYGSHPAPQPYPMPGMQ